MNAPFFFMLLEKKLLLSKRAEAPKFRAEAKVVKKT
jgi:hypothetical protein